MILFACVCYLFTLYYVLLMLYYAAGWLQLKEFVPAISTHHKTCVSVIIPARNEEENIEKTLQAILKQNYPRELLEILVVNDASTDNTAAIVSSYSKRGVRLLEPILIDQHKAYKKKAIHYAITEASGELIITTDADSTMNENWLATLVSFHESTQAQFISAPVLMQPAISVFEKFQALEFAGLVGIGASSLQKGNPNMCNGANVAYTRAAFFAVDGFAGNDSIPSGDDEFLMHKIFRTFPGKALFLKNKEAIVYTKPCKTTGEFIQQRLRWVSKSTKYKDKRITLTLLLCYLFNISIVLNIAGAFFSAYCQWILIFQLLCKIITEGFLLFRITGYFKIRRLMLWLIPEQLIHIIYVAVIGFLGNTVKYKWKGRSV